MLKAIYHFLRSFFFDEEQFVKMSSKLAAKVRGALMLAGLTSVAYSEQIAAYAHNPLRAEQIKLAGVIVAGLSVMLRAGDKTPEGVKDLAAQLTPPGGSAAVPPPSPPAL
jgi:hypothetical protein